ncbi:ETX/MTX2 family pore-forming toxin [Paenibacillus thiaminolyticus]|uniref:ETX/MTX2 family pore-forming toxin n=1 Tax=Paenibacillus thiaminolyticus TaxID=49283 RepID=UPI00232F9D30|nr:ETX/MTX2 family pore-forming toxin [Paenibacillus thiaminolyticus]WCF09016.1 ETX/MTX2 family pore-forming toxin [Paenibacillus thiaminolyticus]WII38275.1 ETX/MTX2 family pore-forming toxin [Paenibacillus thiaminolyticus]
MRKHALKHGLVIGLSALMLGSASAPPQVYAEASIAQEKSIGIVDVNEVLKKVGTYYYKNHLANTVANPESNGFRYTLRANPDSVTPVIDLSIEARTENIHYDSTMPVFIGENTFPNNLDNEQTFNTLKYSKTYTESNSTSMSSGFKVGGAGDLGNKFILPLILEGAGKLNLEYNTGSTETHTTSESYTLEVPSQPVKVPPHKTYKTIVEFSQRTYRGDVVFTGRTENTMANRSIINATGIYTGWMGMQDSKKFTYDNYLGVHYAGLTASQQQEIKNAGVQITTSGYGAAANRFSSIEVTGKGSFSGVIGAELIVTTYDVTDAKNARLVNQRTVPIELD